MNSGKCPYCKKIIAHVCLEKIEANAGTQSYLAVSYLCPHCLFVLSVAIDPVALKNGAVSEIVDQVVDRFQD